MQIDLLYVIFKKDDLYLLLLDIFESTEYFKAKDFYVCLLIKYEV